MQKNKLFFQQTLNGIAIQHIIWQTVWPWDVNIKFDDKKVHMLKKSKIKWLSLLGRKTHH